MLSVVVLGLGACGGKTDRLETQSCGSESADASCGQGGAAGGNAAALSGGEEGGQGGRLSGTVAVGGSSDDRGGNAGKSDSPALARGGGGKTAAAGQAGYSAGSGKDCEKLDEALDHLAYLSGYEIGERHRLRVRSLGTCRYEVSWPGLRSDWDLEHMAQLLLVFHTTPSACVVDQLLFVGYLPEAEACTHYSGPERMWFRDCIVSDNTLRIGVCPGDCQEIGADPLVVVYTGFVLGCTLGQLEGRPDHYCPVGETAGAGGGSTVAEVAGRANTQ